MKYVLNLEKTLVHILFGSSDPEIFEGGRTRYRKRALEKWETKIANFEVTPQAIWPIAKSLANRGEPRAPSVVP
jgi:hypothetical protein